MIAFAGLRRRPAGLLRGTTLALVLAILGAAGAAAADIDVVVDKARLVKLPDRVATIVIGNPLIADATVQSGGMLVITGKGYGTTNILALDRTGAVLLDKSVEVRGPTGETVVVYRGAERESYSCTPQCERRSTLGDGPTYFDAVINQIKSRNDHAQGAVPAK